MLLRKFHRDRRQWSEIGAVIENLNAVLNTKKGFGFWRQEFGIGDYNEYKARKKVIETLIKEIKENVATFEPRVQLEDIQEVPSGSPFRLRFEMRGVFLDDAKPLYLVVDALRHVMTIEG